MRGVRVAVGAAVLGLALAGCGGDEPQAGTLGSEPVSEETTTEPNESPTAQSKSTDSDQGEDSEPDGDNGDDGQSDESDKSDKSGGDVELSKNGDDVDPDLSAAAEGFVQRFMDVYDEAAVTGDFSALTEMYADGCYRCERYVTWFTSIYDDGGKVEGDGFTDPQFSIIGDTGESVLVRVDSTIAEFDVLDSSGKVTESSPAEPHTDIFEVTEGSDGWQVVSWSVRGSS